MLLGHKTNAAFLPAKYVGNIIIIRLSVASLEACGVREDSDLDRQLHS